MTENATESVANPSLLYLENLTLPSFQVVVITANIRCKRCMERVSLVISKMSGLREYTVDVRNKQVIIEGDFKPLCNLQNDKKKERVIDQPKSVVR